MKVKVKMTVEITDEYNFEELKEELKTMSLKELEDYVKEDIQLYENEIKTNLDCDLVKIIDIKITKDEDQEDQED